MKAEDIKERSDGELLDTARTDPESRDSKDAASELLGRYQQRVYAWCLRHARDHEHALDLAQEVLIDAYRNLASFKGRAQFSSWMFAIARNRCISAVRRPRLLYDDEREPDQFRSEMRNPEETLEEKLDEESLVALIRAELTQDEQEVIWLRCFERVPVDSITRMLGIKQASGARGVLQSARRKLRTVLADVGVDLEGDRP